MAQVRVTARTAHLGAHHAKRVVGMGAYALAGERQPEAGPARPAVVLRLRTEQIGATAHAAIHAGVLVVRVGPAKGTLRALLPRDVILERREPRPHFPIVR